MLYFYRTAHCYLATKSYNKPGCLYGEHIKLKTYIMKIFWNPPMCFCFVVFSSFLKLNEKCGLLAALHAVLECTSANYIMATTTKGAQTQALCHFDTGSHISCPCHSHCTCTYSCSALACSYMFPFV